MKNLEGDTKSPDFCIRSIFVIHDALNRFTTKSLLMQWFMVDLSTPSFSMGAVNAGETNTGVWGWASAVEHHPDFPSWC